MIEELQYQIALKLLPNIGDVIAKKLLLHFKTAENVFRAKQKQLKSLDGIGEFNANQIKLNKDILKRAEKELSFIDRHNIKCLVYGQEGYPTRLLHCYDSPALLFYKGKADLNSDVVVSVVGTRTPDDYGKQTAKAFVEDLRETKALVVSGLAYGVDILSHRTALESGLDTIGVVAHGLDRVYPGLHKEIALRMLQQGGILTDFLSETNPDAVNFPKRNRIVAGMCDALVVIQSKRGGGSLITATIANSYNKDVFAFPGRANEEMSEGCNGLIKRQRAIMIENAIDLIDAMNWNHQNTNKSGKQAVLPVHLSPEEEKVVSAFQGKGQLQIDELCYKAEMTISELSGVLLQLELNGLISSRPGKMYEFLG